MQFKFKHVLFGLAILVFWPELVAVVEWSAQTVLDVGGDATVEATAGHLIAVLILAVVIHRLLNVATAAWRQARRREHGESPPPD